MDVLTVSVLTNTVSSLLSATASEAGKRAWQALVDGTRRLLGTDPEAPSQLDSAEPDPQAIAASLIAAADSDPEFRRWLHQWHADTTIDDHSTVTNSIAGRVTNAVQARDIRTISFGS